MKYTSLTQQKKKPKSPEKDSNNNSGYISLSKGGAKKNTAQYGEWAVPVGSKIGFHNTRPSWGVFSNDTTAGVSGLRPDGAQSVEDYNKSVPGLKVLNEIHQMANEYSINQQTPPQQPQSKWTPSNVDPTKTMDFPLTESGQQYVSQMKAPAQPSYFKTGTRGISDKWRYRRNYSKTDEIIKGRDALIKKGVNPEIALGLAEQYVLSPRGKQTIKPTEKEFSVLFGAIDAPRINAMAIGFSGGGIKFVSPEMADKIIANAVKSQLTRSDLVKITSGRLKSGAKYDTYRTMAADPTMRKELTAIAKNKKIPLRSKIGDYLKSLFEKGKKVEPIKERPALINGAYKSKAIQERPINPAIASVAQKPTIEAIKPQKGKMIPPKVKTQTPKKSELLVQKAKKYNSAEEFINGLPSGGQEGRLIGKGQGYYAVEKVTGKIDPIGTTEKMITVYRGVPKGGINTLVDGDYVSKNKNAAVAYGGNVKSFQIPENQLYEAVGRNDLIFYSGKTKQQLTDIYSQAVKETKPAKISAVPVSGQGRVSGIAKSIEAKAIEQGLTKKFGKLAEFTPTTIKEQALKVSKLLNKDIEEVRKIIRGEKPLPDGIRGISLIDGVERYLQKNPNAEMAYELANSPLVSGASLSAQELTLARMREPDSFTAKIRELKKVRESKVRHLEAKKKVLKKSLKKEIQKTNLSKTELSWDRFLDKIIC